ncbi:unnamed protein product, partial [Rhizoctonia solani]
MALLAQFGLVLPLDKYVGSYIREQMEQWPSELDKKQLRCAREAIERISNVNLGSATATNHVELSDLEIVFKSSGSAAVYSYFAAPNLVRGCIHLMFNLPLSREEKQSLRGEEGHYQQGLSGEIIGSKTEPILHFSRRAMSVVLDLIDHSSRDQDSYNCIIGWSRCSESDDREELVTQTDASTLLANLWADTKHFFKVMFWTYSPGISGVVYLPW